MPKRAVDEKEVPDNAVFWSIVGVITLFVIVLAVAMLVRTGATGNIVYQWSSPERPYRIDPVACTDVPRCGSEISFMCCAKEPLPGGAKCTSPLRSYNSESPHCPAAMPYACGCPEKFQFRQSFPVPSR